MEALAFLLFAAGCFVAAHAIDVRMHRRQLARRTYKRPYRGARPMTDTEYYYFGDWINKEW
jgi:hypothetical protein